MRRVVRARDTLASGAVITARWIDLEVRRHLGTASAVVERLLSYAATSGAAALVRTRTGQSVVIVGEPTDDPTVAVLERDVRAMPADATLAVTANGLVARVDAVRALAIALPANITGARERIERVCTILARGLCTSVW